VGIRETLNKNPAITTGGTIGIIVIALGFIVWQLMGESQQTTDKMYFTVDDGKTLFSDSAQKNPPFDKDGKQAVKAYVFTCDDEKTQFVAYLERLTPEAKAQLEKAMKEMPVPDPKAGPGATPANFGMLEAINMEGTEVKKPGDAKWVKRASMDAEKVMTISCPDGKAENLAIVLP
jgi:hypothetical protein